MRKIALITLLSLPLFAGFFPQTVHTSVKNINNSDITLNSKLPASGMSGAIIHSYANGLSAITSYLTQNKDGKAILIDSDVVHHNKLPTIKTPVKLGDKVIGGYLYNNVLVLAPDVDTYTKITKSHHKKWIHPDLYALHLSVEGEDKPTRANLLEFAKKYQVGLIYIVRKDSAVLLDPISGKIISQKAVSNLPATGQFPFYMHFDKLESGWFGGEAKGSYYPTMGAI